MSKAKTLTAIDFSKLSSEHVQRMVKELYDHKLNEKREPQFGMTEDRRRQERRQAARTVMLDTRSSTSRRRSTGRRRQDENGNKVYSVGIDYYA